MNITAANLTDGIRVDKATQKGSVRDVIQTVTNRRDGSHLSQVLSRILKDNPSLNPKCVKLRINGKGRETSVADAATLIEVAWLCPGKAAVAFRREGAESVCRILGGDLSLVEEIQRRHAQLTGTAEEEDLLADALHDDRARQTLPHKRGLDDDDDEVYAAKKQQVLRQIRQEASGTELAIIKQHAQGSMSILDMLSAGNAPPYTTGNHAAATDHQTQCHSTPWQHDREWHAEHACDRGTRTAARAQHQPAGTAVDSTDVRKQDGLACCSLHCKQAQGCSCSCKEDLVQREAASKH